MSGSAVPVLGDLVSYTVAPIISWAILPGTIRKFSRPVLSRKRLRMNFQLL